MTTAPGALKGDPSKNEGIPPDDPSNYTGSCSALYDYKMQLKALYLTDTVQLIVAGVIFANFIVVMFSVTQYVLDNPNVDSTLEIFDKVFIYFFLVELFINMFTSAQGVVYWTPPNSGDKQVQSGEPAIISPWIWAWEFWVGENWAWNWFDFIVIMVPVTVSTMPWASSIRILRLFRVIRVLKSIAKFEALQVVASSVSRSMSGVGATAIFILITVCMYSIIAVEMFGREANGLWYDSDAGEELPRSTWEWRDVAREAKEFKETGVSHIYGKKYVDMNWKERAEYYNENCDGVPLFQYFGNLRRSMLTMFVFTTVEGWPDLGWCLGKTYAFGSAFCTTFIIITALLMANIVVAIFTNKMEEAQEQVQAEQLALRKQRQASIQRALGGDNVDIQGVDLDGDGIADEFVIDADGDGIADVVLSKDEMAQAQGGGTGNIENMGELTNILKNFQSKLDAIASKVDTLMSKSQKGRI